MSFSLQTRANGGVNTPGIFCLGSAVPYIITTATLDNFSQVNQLDEVVQPFDTRIACTLSGIVPRASNQLLIIENVGAAILTIAANSGSSTAGYRFLLDSALALDPNDSAFFIYSSIAAAWLFVAGGNAGGGGGGGVGVSTFVTPAALALGTTNDYAPAGLAANVVLRLAANAGGSTLGGLLALATGSRVTLVNISAVDIVLANAGGGSAAANRFSLPGGADYGIPVGDAIDLIYDGTSLAWRKG